MENIRDVLITHNGTSKTLRDWADLTGVDYVTARMRYTRGKRTFQEIFGTVRGYKRPEPEYRSPNYRDKSLQKRNIKERIEKLEQRLDALKQVVLDIAERIDK